MWARFHQCISLYQYNYITIFYFPPTSSSLHFIGSARGTHSLIFTQIFPIYPLFRRSFFQVTSTPTPNAYRYPFMINLRMFFASESYNWSLQVFTGIHRRSMGPSEDLGGMFCNQVSLMGLLILNELPYFLESRDFTCFPHRGGHSLGQPRSPLTYSELLSLTFLGISFPLHLLPLYIPLPPFTPNRPQHPLKPPSY